MRSISHLDTLGSVSPAHARPAPLANVLPAVVNAGVWLVLVGAGVFFGMAVVFLSLPALTALAVMVAIGLAVSPLIGFRGVAAAGLLVAIPLPIAKHLTYRAGYVGAADGLTIELVDIWLVWLIAQLAYLRKTGELKPVRGLVAYCIPLVFLLFADIVSIRNAADVELSLYGVAADLRAVVIFIVLAVTLAQGEDEKRGTLTGLLWGVILIGSLCVVQAALRVNFWAVPNPNEGTEWEGAFRAGGFSTATVTASYLAMLLPFVFVEVVRARSISRRQLARAALVIGLLGLAGTLTRTAISLVVIGSLPLIARLFRMRVLKVRHFAAVLVAAIAVAFASKDLIESRADEGANNMDARIGLIGTALNMAADSPLTGQGINQYMLKMDEFKPKLQLHPFEYIVHNKYLLTLAETGAIGLTAFIWFLLIGLKRAITLARSRSLLGLGALCSLLVTLGEMNMEIYGGGFPVFTIMTTSAFIAALSATDEHADDAAQPTAS